MGSACVVCGEKYDAIDGEAVLFNAFVPMFRGSGIETYESIKSLILEDNDLSEWLDASYDRCSACDYVIHNTSIHELCNNAISCDAIVDYNNSCNGEEGLVLNKILGSIEESYYTNGLINGQLEEIADAGSVIPKKIRSIFRPFRFREDIRKEFEKRTSEIWCHRYHSNGDTKSEICKMGGIGYYLNVLLKVSFFDTAGIGVPNETRNKLSSYLLRKIPGKYSVRQQVMNKNLKSSLRIETDIYGVVEKQIAHLSNVGFESVGTIKDFIDGNFLYHEGVLGGLCSKKNLSVLSAAMVYVASVLTDHSLTQYDIKDNLVVSLPSIRNNQKKLEGAFRSVDWIRFERKKRGCKTLEVMSNGTVLATMREVNGAPSGI